MKIQRTNPPSAAPIFLKDILYGLLGLYSGASYLKKVERELKDHFGVKHLFMVSSGKAALTLSLQALRSLNPEKSEVIIPAYTCSSVPSAVLKAGLKVTLCDIQDSDLSFDIDMLKGLINEQTLCVVPCHLFGIPADLNNIKKLCRDKNIALLEDAAQAMGGSYRGEKLGTIGDIGFFSLGRGKNITSGSGGIIVTDSGIIAEAINNFYMPLEEPTALESAKELLEIIIMSLFIHPALYWFPAGLPFLRLGETVFHKDFPIKKFSGMKAALLHEWKKRLSDSNENRLETSKFFKNALGLKSGWSSGTPCLRLPVIVESEEARDQIYSDLDRLGLGASLMYPCAINEVDELREHFEGNSFPSAQRLVKRILTLPTHHLLSVRDKIKICEQFSGRTYF